LHHAVAQNFTEIARVLIAEGIDIGTADQEGRTALMIASARGNGDLVMLIRQSLKKQSD
jgi:ankyrin repeat protein